MAATSGKTTLIKQWIFVLTVSAWWSSASQSQDHTSNTLEAKAHDGVKVYGEMFVGDLTKDAPLILLFHQGGSNGRGEYSPLVPWFIGAGFRVVAWDLRSGGNTYGGHNSTKAGLASSESVSYCDAYPDLQAALDYAIDEELAKQVIVWGSSYSGALVFRLASENPDSVVKIVAASPASGGPMADCRAIKYIDGVKAPALVLRPQSEMERDSAIEQRKTLEAAGVEFLVIEQGVHGSSMLVDQRTQHDMTQARQIVASWLKGF